MDKSGAPQQSKFFSAAVPESSDPVRQSHAKPSAQPSIRPAKPAVSAAELRLLLWSELPERHRDEVCRQIRVRCDAFISSTRLDRRERKPETDRLVSEVVAHLLRATSVGIEEMLVGRVVAQRNLSEPPAQTVVEPEESRPWLMNGGIEPSNPALDARVTWLVNDTCNRQALFHRYEDTRRRDRGGKWDGSGYPLVAVDHETIEHLAGQYDPTEEDADSLAADDSRRAWQGLVELASRQFGPDDDVVALVQVLAEDQDTQESFASQWPIGKIVLALNRRSAGSTWDDDRVDNAKRRLTRLIVRLKEANGLDAIDLRALLARYARERVPSTSRRR